MTSYYDEKYFEWQKECGKIGGILNKFKFESYVKNSDVLLDFGCGGLRTKTSPMIGYVLRKHL